MSDAKGRAKKATGDLTGDKKLKREGQTEQTTEKVKGGVDKAADKVKGVLGRDKR